MFLLTSAGLWTIRIVQIHWIPCKNDVVAKFGIHPDSAVAKGVEQQHSAAQSEFMRTQIHTA
jgi:hypothetical protein